MRDLGDIYLIESAMLSGEMDDMMNFIKKRLKVMDRQVKYDRKGLLKNRVRILQSILSFFSNEIDHEKLETEIFQGLSGEWLGEKEKLELAKRLSYTCEYCRDRYNVNLPSFNGKRCDDK
ncbi:hypothetical protein [Caldiplasma sukawensis]